jgi:RNA polymerase sigma-70 factor (ECF subfamily)
MDQEISDENLMLDYAKGNADAFEQLYHRHKGPLYRFILRQSAPQFADEIFQDIWLKVIGSRTSYKIKAAFKTWLYRIARNRIIDYYRRQNLRPLENHSETLSLIRDNERVQPENQFETRLQHEHLMEAIAELPNEQREVFLLKEEAGLTINEIADITDVSYEAAKSRLRYAMKKLRQHLEFNHE